MRLLLSIAAFAFAVVGSTAYSDEPTSPPTESDSGFPMNDSGTVTLQEIDYQIKLLNQYIENYNNKAYIFNQKAESLLSRDFLGYRHYASMSQQCKAIADDLTKHLQQLEAQRAEIVQSQSQKQAPAKK